MDPKQILDLILQHARGVWRFRWKGMTISWTIFLIAVGFIYTMPNQYIANTRVYVDTENVLRPLLRGLFVETDVMNDVSLMTRALLTRPHLEEVVRTVDLDLTVTTEAEKEALLSSLEKRIDISSSRRENIYTIEVQDRDRGQALKIVNALLQTFVEDTIGNNMKDSQSAEETLKAQIDDYEQRLVIAEERLSDFKKQNVGLMPGEGGGYYAQLDEALRAKDLAERQLRVARETQATIERQLSGVDPLFGDAASSSYDTQIQSLEAGLNQLLLEYTDQHPDVVRTRERLEILRERRTQELAGPRTGFASSDGRELNPVYQNLQISLSQAKVEVAALQAQIRDHDREIGRLQGLVEVLPEIEAQLTRLNRDYDVVQRRYQDMLLRWENLQTGKIVNSGRDQVTFRVIEPPFASLNPAAPNRPLLIGGSFVLALGAGLAFAILMHLLNPVFSTEAALNYLGITILGHTSYQRSEGLLKLLRIKTTALVLAGMLLVAAAGVSVMYAKPGALFVQSLLAMN